MITKDNYIAEIPKEIKQDFLELNVYYHLRKANMSKLAGYSCLNVFKFSYLFLNIRILFHAHKGKKAGYLPGKGMVYRFLYKPTFSWRQFLLSLSIEIIRLIRPLTSNQRIMAFVIDDSIYSRNRSKPVELLANILDHSSKRTLKDTKC